MEKTKKQIIEELKKRGFNANYKNVLFSPFEFGKGFVLVIQKREIIKVVLE